MIDPGKLFLNTHGGVNSPADVLAYADFLRIESEQDAILPIDLNRIFDRFQIPTPRYSSINGLQGLLLDAINGTILINANDIPTRQRFSLAHELIELLFYALPNGKTLGNGWILKKPGGFSGTTKEFLCNWAAANLLMPPDHVKICIERHGVNFDSARIISEICDVSFSAALIQAARLSSGRHSVVLWENKNKPSELKNQIGVNQMPLFNFRPPLPEKKLRVVWSIGNESAPYIPKDKSLEKTSLIFKAYESGLETSGNENLNLDGRYLQSCRTENRPFPCEDGTQVLSLIEHL